MDSSDNGGADVNEHRRSDRKAPENVVPVVNTLTGEQMGHIGNLSVEGMMLIARMAIEPGLMFQICFSLADVAGKEQAFNVGAICLWCSEASAPNTFWAGFEMMDMSDEEALALRSIVTGL